MDAPANPLAPEDRAGEIPAYRALAPHYDWIMSHVDYDAWGRYLRRAWEKHGARPRRILELAAGTCPFASRGTFPPDASVVYSDLSPAMLAQAEPGRGPAPRRVAADALAWPFKARFDLVLMIYDAINYLMEEEDIAALLAQAGRHLEPGGLFIFDVTTEANSRRHFENALYWEEGEGCSYIRESWYDAADRIQHNDFTLFVRERDGRYRRLRELHAQRIYPLARLKRLLAEAGLETLGAYDNLSFREARDGSERAHFVARAPQ